MKRAPLPWVTAQKVQRRDSIVNQLFTPEREDLRNVQAYLAREIKRLQRRHAAITKILSGF